MANPFSRLWSRRSIETKASALESWLEILRSYRRSRTGVTVNVDTAIRVAAVLACCRVLAEGVAQMPWKLQYRYDNGERKFARNLPLFNVLYRRPNEWQTSFEFREMLMYHAALTGDAHAYISRDGNKRIIELLPLQAGSVKTVQDKNTDVTYQWRDLSGKLHYFKREEIFHLRGPSWNGYSGLDILAVAREAIGLSIAAEETQADLHKNGLQLSGIISMDGSLGDKARDRLRDRLKEFVADESMGVLVLDQAAKFERMVSTSVDAQHLETRKHQIEEICRIFRVFPQMVGYADKTATYASAEQFFIAHVIHSLGPWVERWEQATARDLLSDYNDQGDFELVAKMSMQGLMRGDARTRAAFYQSGILTGWMTRADAREFEDLPPISGLEEPLTPANMNAGSGKPVDATPTGDTTDPNVGATTP